MESGQEEKKRFVLFYAARDCDIKQMTKLIKEGANINVCDYDGYPLLSYVVDYELEGPLKVLLEAGVQMKPEPDGYKPWLHAVHSHLYKSVKIFWRYAPVLCKAEADHLCWLTRWFRINHIDEEMACLVKHILKRRVLPTIINSRVLPVELVRMLDEFL